MKTRFYQRFIYLLVPPLLAASLPAGSAWGWSNIYDDFDTCTGINCNTTKINANIGTTPDGSTIPFTVEVIGNRNGCLRLDLDGQQNGTDMKMVVIAPNGTVYRNDDRASGDSRPLIKIASAPVQGWYTVYVSQYNGRLQTPQFPSITLLYGQYNNGNPNCASPTPAF